jgi:hypothetical protein
MRRAPIVIALAALAVACLAPAASLAATKVARPVPPSFFGIVP